MRAVDGAKMDGVGDGDGDAAGDGDTTRNMDTTGEGTWDRAGDVIRRTLTSPPGSASTSARQRSQQQSPADGPHPGQRTRPPPGRRRVILHCDADAFFVQVERHRDASLRHVSAVAVQQHQDVIAVDAGARAAGKAPTETQRADSATFFDTVKVFQGNYSSTTTSVCSLYVSSRVCVVPNQALVVANKQNYSAG